MAMPLIQCRANSSLLPETMVGQSRVDMLTQVPGDRALLFDAVTDRGVVSSFSNKFDANDFTVMFWIRPTGTNNINGTILQQGSRSYMTRETSSTRGWAVGISSNQIIFSFGDGTSGSYVSTDAVTLLPNTWYHCAITRSRTATPATNRVKIYVNAASRILAPNIANTTGSVNGVSTIAPIIPSTDLRLGGSANYFIKSLRVYETVYNQQAIADRKDAGPLVTDPLAGAWELNWDGGGGVAVDSSWPAIDRISMNLTGADWQPISYSYAVNATYYGGFTGNEVVYNYSQENGQSMGKKLGPSVIFNGTSYGMAEDSASLEPQNFTISLWFKADSIGGTLIQKVYSTTFNPPSSYEITLDGATNRVKVAVVQDGGGGAINGTIMPYTTSTVSTGKWNHFVFSRTSSKLIMYLNGVKQEISNSGTPIAYTAGQPLYIGGRSSMFHGSIDDVKIFNTALADADVTNLYKGTYNSTSNLAGYWDFGEDSGNTALDKSNNNNELTLTNVVRQAEGPITVDDSLYKNNGYDLFGFENDNLVNCVAGIVLAKSPFRCFITNSKYSNVNIMTSRSYINNASGDPVIEIATLFYPPKNLIVGDSYLGSSDLDNFAYWGRNLTETGGGVGASGLNETFWGLTGYTPSANARATLDTASSSYQEYIRRITELKNEAQRISISDLNNSATWWLQSDSTIGSGTNNTAKYPNGKVWLVTKPANVQPFELSGSHTFNGIGTIIFESTLSIGSGVTIKPFNNSSEYKLGLITVNHPDDATKTTGGINLSGNNTIFAAIFSAGSLLNSSPIPSSSNFTFNGDNVNLAGSFVSRNFNFNARSYIRFYYDKRFSDGWPPGFRYLNMPHPTE